MTGEWSEADRGALGRRLWRYHLAWQTVVGFVEHMYSRSNRVTVLAKQISHHIHTVYLYGKGDFLFNYDASNIVFYDELPDVDYLENAVFDDCDSDEMRRYKRTITNDERALIERLFVATRDIVERVERERHAIFNHRLGDNYPARALSLLGQSMTKLAAINGM